MYYKLISDLEHSYSDSEESICDYEYKYSVKKNKTNSNSKIKKFIELLLSIFIKI